jgi:hypothetical protein
MRGAVMMSLHSRRCCAPSPCAGRATAAATATAGTQLRCAECLSMQEWTASKHGELETGEGGQGEVRVPAEKGGATGHRRR